MSEAVINTNEEAGRAQIKFGTDGWRAVIAREWTFANVERVAQAYADFLLKHSTLQSSSDDAAVQSGVPGAIQETVQEPATDTKNAAPLWPSKLVAIVGYDRRFLSEEFALRVAQVLAGNDIDVRLFEHDVPTQLVSWAVQDKEAAGGVMITASHNPPEFNGFKIKAAWGGSATPEMTGAVEALVDSTAPRRSEQAINREGLAESIQRYQSQIESYVDLERLRSARGSIVVDPMHGTGGRWVESFLQGGQLQVETIRANRDPLFGGVNPEPIDSNLHATKEQVRQLGALVGLVTDGDADRVGAVNELGETMTMHQVVPLMILHFARYRRMTGGVVRTFSQSVLTKRIAEAHGLRLYDTPIGFKYIADLMMREKIVLGGEESGGIGVQGHIPERDGILNSLLFLEAIVAAGKPPSEMVKDLHREFGEFHFGRKDLHNEVARGLKLVATLAASPPTKIADYNVQSVETLDGTKLIFDDESWLLFRQSGTEPMLRIYAEATSIEKMHKLLDEGEKKVSSEQ